jgi:hypothetical protein
VGTVNDAIQQGIADRRIAEHHMMPWALSGELFRSKWLILVTRCLVVACRSVIAGQGVVLG